MKIFKVVKADFVWIALACVILMCQYATAASVIDSGTTEPAGPVVGQEFYRTDRHQHEIYDGGQWVEQDQGVINAKAFGAVGDGVADDTAAIQNAINSIPAEGGTVLLPTGAYKLTSTIILKPMLRLKGSIYKGWGNGVTSKGTNLLSQHEGDCLSFSYGSTTVANISISNMNIAGYKGSYSTGHGIYFKNGSNAEFRNVVVYDFPQNNIHFEGGGHLYIRDIYTPHAGENGIYIDSEYCSLLKAATDGNPYALTLGPNSLCTDVTDSHFEGAIIASVRILGGQGHRLLNNILTDSPVGIVDGTPGNAPFGVQIIGNRFMGGAVGQASGSIAIDLSNPLSYDFIINSNYIAGFHTGIKCYNWGYDVITGNIIRGNDVAGLDMNPTASENKPIIVSSNVISGVAASVKHQRGNKVTYIGNYGIDGATGGPLPFTIISDNPIIIPAP